MVLRSAGWLVAPCPLAPWRHSSGRDAHPSFAVKVRPGGESSFNCYACESGDLLRLVELLAGHGAEAPRYRLRDALRLLADEEVGGVSLSVDDYEEERRARADAVFPESWLDAFPPAATDPRALRYLSERRLTEAVIRQLDVRVDVDRRRVCFPIRNWTGGLVGLRGRSMSGGGPRYYDYACGGQRNPLPWLGEHWLSHDEPVLMVESVFDVASVLRVYPNTAAPLSVGIGRDKARRMSWAAEVVTLFDGDQGGDKGRAAVDRYLRDSLCTHVHCPPGRDPGDLRAAELRELLAPHLLLLCAPDEGKVRTATTE